MITSSLNYVPLLKWARSNGAIIPESLSFPQSPQGHCRTSVSVPKGTRLFHIPHNIIITRTVAIYALPQLLNQSIHAQICGFLAHQRRKEGFWKPYLDSLPEKFETPAYFQENELKVLEGTNLSLAWRERVNAWMSEFEKVNALVEGVTW